MACTAGEILVLVNKQGTGNHHLKTTSNIMAPLSPTVFIERECTLLLARMKRSMGSP